MVSSGHGDGRGGCGRNDRGAVGMLITARSHGDDGSGGSSGSHSLPAHFFYRRCFPSSRLIPGLIVDAVGGFALRQRSFQDLPPRPLRGWILYVAGSSGGVGVASHKTRRRWRVAFDGQRSTVMEEKAAASAFIVAVAAAAPCLWPRIPRERDAESGGEKGEKSAKHRKTERGRERGGSAVDSLFGWSLGV
jgi:hypothetical protein